MTEEKIIEDKKEVTETQAKKPAKKIQEIPVKRKTKKSLASSRVPEKKIKIVKKLAEELKIGKTVMILSTKNVPSSQFQKIKKDLRGKAAVKVVKKSILNRALDETKIAELIKLKEYVQADCAVAISDEDAFELAEWLTEHRNPISAKQGQIANEDIKVEAGPTDLMPGPAISELGGVGLKVSVEEGKIAIREPKIIVKKEGAITEQIASVLQKLGIKPFMIGLNPAVIYDSKDKKIYVGIKIDKEQARAELILCHAKALGFAKTVRYYCRETIGYLLAKADAEAKALEKLSPAPKEEKAEESKQETKVEEEKEQTETGGKEK